MKNKNKVIPVLLTGIALAIGIAISNAVIQNSFVLDEVKASSTYSHTISSQAWTKYEAKTLSGVSWTAAATGGAYWSYDATKGQQFGSESKPAKPLILSTSGIAGTISSITIGTSGASSIAATIGVSVGGSAFGGTAKAITASNALYTFTGSASGEIIFTWSQTSNKALFVKSISIDYSTKTLSNILVTGAPTKTSYYVGESFSPVGLTITANYSDSSTSNVTNSCTFSPNPLTSETTSVTASYTELGVTQTASIDGLTVNTRSLVSISVSTNPSKMTYFVGESFSLTGMVITAMYDVGDPVVGYSDYSYSPTSTFSSTGFETITIVSLENNEITTSIQVQVNEAPAITELFISEYLEGEGNNKAVEIYNGTGQAVNLSNYKIRIYSNGSTSPTNTIDLTGSLSNSNVFVVCNQSSVQTIKNLSNMQSNLLGFNGDDAITLSKDSANIDIIGAIGYATKFAEDVTLVRKSSVVSPTTTFSFSEWNSYAKDTIDYLGSHTTVSVPSQSELDAIAYGTSFLSATASGCAATDSVALSGVWGDLEIAYNALSNDAKAYLTTLTPNVGGNDAEHAVARYIYIIAKYGETTFVDFMNLDIQPAPDSSNTFDINSDDILPLIIIISIVGLTVIVGYYYNSKKKEA